MRLLPALVACAPLLSFASATTPDYTDLWYNTSESGWGANVVQQGNTMFITFFVYASNNQPTWYVASAVTQAGGATSGTFTGTLFQTTGPYFGGPFNASAVGNVPVGQVTFNASGSNNATLSYSVNGVNVSKSVTRQTWAGDNYNGAFLGGSMGTWSSCGGARNGYVESGATFTLTQTGTSVQIREDGSGYTCTYNATYGANGRFGTFTGSGICSDGVNFTFTATDAEVSRDAFSARLSLQQVGACRFDGRMGGIRKGAL